MATDFILPRIRGEKTVWRRVVNLVMVLALLAAQASFVAPPAEAGSGGPGPSAPATGAALPDPGDAGLLQFTSGGHVLAFGRDGVIMAAPSHMLKTGFVNGNRVSPEAAGNSDELGSQRNVEEFVSQARRPVPPVSIGGNGLEQDSPAAGKAPPLGRVTYRGLWDGVTLVYEASGGAIVKSTYYVDTATRGDAAGRIRLGYNRPVSLDEKGDLVVAYENGLITERAPVAWQEVGGQRIPVTAAYVLYGQREVGFSLGEYLPGVPVVIDPESYWVTFLGGSYSDEARGIAVDSSGNVYVAGYSGASWGSPVRAYTASDDAFAAKLDSSGVLVWNTFLGGSGSDMGYGVALDSSGNVYVTGFSYATWGSPVRSYTGYDDAFAAKLDSSGVLQWNTFLGGSGGDSGYGVAVDGSGNVYVTGLSGASWGSPKVPFFLGGLDAFAAKLDSSGVLQWNTFLGGSGSDIGYGVAVDGSGNVYVAGRSTTSWGSPVRSYTGSDDAFAAKLDGSGVRVWHTFLGGSGSDYGQGLAVDGSGNVYVAGYSGATWGSPVRAYTERTDGFAAKLDNSGGLVWNTFLGGSGFDFCYGIAVDASGNVYMAGESRAAWGSPVLPYRSADDVFAARLNSSGVLQWNTFLGGTAPDYAKGNGIAVDGGGNVYVSGRSEGSWARPVRAYTGADAFAAKVNSSGGGPALTFTIYASAGANGTIESSGLVTLDSGASQTYTITPSTGYHINTLTVDGNAVTPAVASYTFSNITADHTISVTFAINSYTVTPSAGAGGTINPSGAVTVNHGASRTFTITPNTGYHIETLTVDGNAVTPPVASYNFSNVTADHTISVTFAVNLPVAGFNKSLNPSSGLAPLTVTFTDTSTGIIASWSWNFGDGTGSSSQNPTKVYNIPGNYAVTLTVSNAAGASTAVPQTIGVYGFPVANFTGSPTLSTAPAVVTFTDSSTGNITGWSWNFGDGTGSSTQNPAKTYSADGTYSVTLLVTNPAGSNVFARPGYIVVQTNQAQTSLTMGIDNQGAYIAAYINRFYNTLTGETVNLSDGIRAFDAYVTYSSTGASMKASSGVGPFTSVTASLNTAGGEYNTKSRIAASQSLAAPSAPVELFRLYPWLTGGTATPVKVKLRFDSLTRAGGLPVWVNTDAMKTFLRGDASNDAMVTITDAMYIGQYLAGIRNLGETTALVNPINAATVKNDSAGGSIITITDAMFIGQMLAGLRDADYNPV